MKFDDSYDFFVFSDEPKHLSTHLNNYKAYKESLGKVSAHISNDVENYLYYREYTGSHESSALYRKRDDASDALVALWMSRVKKIVAMFTAFNDVKVFESISKEELKEIAKLSVNPEAILELETYLLEKGIILVIEPSIAGLKLDGCVYINPNGQAVVALSLRLNRLDNFWFTLLHELAHLCLHADQLAQPIFEYLDSEPEALIEKQADKLALDSFVPRSAWRTCSAKVNFKISDLNEFASRMHVHPSIVAGRIRRETKRYDRFSDVVTEFDVKRILGL